ncbi:MAG: hypothetical protein M1818_001520 [Claussenomyces sp. TS43310]|nr:MAG: hypothetical protein M1818_001520 [Claussenomyces sp. TS43310]
MASSSVPSEFSLFKPPTGPAFIDTAECNCALEQSAEKAWKCSDILTPILHRNDSGKWFLPTNPGNLSSLNDTDVWGAADNPPNPDDTYIIEPGSSSLVLLNSTNRDKLSEEDQDCTGKNDTKASAQYYAQVKSVLEDVLKSRSCVLEDAKPLPLQNASSWNATGCLPGFFCPNNNVTTLPQYCPPVTACQKARSSGFPCSPMGLLEPAPCDPGFYCPSGGKERLKCPAESYCPIGTVQPIKCDAFSKCPAGSTQNLTIWPLTMLMAIDFFLAMVLLANKLAMYPRGRGGKVAPGVPDPLLAKETGPVFEGARSRRYGRRNRQNPAYPEISDFEMDAEPSLRMLGRNLNGFDVAMDESWKYSNMFGKAAVAKDQRDLRAFVQSLSKCLGATRFGLSFEFQDLKFRPPKSIEPVLSEVTGNIDSGSLWGVMGASGAGKSTFVNVLMGRQAHTGGITKVNGDSSNIRKYKKLIGYVPQDDIISPELTLSHVANSLVGSTAAPVVSGGQRKRVSVGMELAAAPMAIFLDEPTSGLDATSASSIMTTLKAISRLGITIVTIIHQPRREIFESLDSLILLGQGRMIYQGEEGNVVPYFEKLGFKFPKNDNPADVVGDIIAGRGHLYKERGDASVGLLIDRWKKRFQDLTPFQERKLSGGSMKETCALHTTIKVRGAPWYRQIYHCFNRSLLQQYRLKSGFFSEIGVGVLAGSLIGLAELQQKGVNFRGIYRDPYERLSSSIDYTSIPQLALLIGIAIGLTASAPGVKIFGEEKLLYRREAAAGHNRFAYYVGKVISTLPRMLLATLHFTVFFYSISTPRISFADSFVANLLYCYCIYGLASCVSMVTLREDGPLIATILSLIMGVFNGMSPPLRNIHKWHMIWFWHICPGMWLAEGYFAQSIRVWSHLYQIKDAADFLGYDLGGFPRDLAILLALGSAYRVIAFFGLIFWN